MTAHVVSIRRPRAAAAPHQQETERRAHRPAKPPRTSEFGAQGVPNAPLASTGRRAPPT